MPPSHHRYPSFSWDLDEVTMASRLQFRLVKRLRLLRFVWTRGRSRLQQESESQMAQFIVLPNTWICCHFNGDIENLSGKARITSFRPFRKMTSSTCTLTKLFQHQTSIYKSNPRVRAFQNKRKLIKLTCKQHKITSPPPDPGEL